MTNAARRQNLKNVQVILCGQTFNSSKNKMLKSYAVYIKN